MNRYLLFLRRLLWIPLAGLALFTSPALAAVDDGHFELGDGIGTVGSGDILGSDTQPGPDWADLFDANGNSGPLFGGLAASFIQDDLSLKGAVDDTTFASSNKNNDLISTWQWDTGNNPPKDDFSAGYVYAKLVDGKLRIYGGLERVANNGDAHVDIEFNQSAVSLDKDPPCGNDGTDGTGDGAPCEFQGAAQSGDLLVAMDFEIGGDFGILRIFQHDGAQYNLVTSLGTEGCNELRTICAFNNAAPIPGGPWPNFNRSGNEVLTIDTNGFTEFGIDVGTLLSASPCFASVNFKSRTSQSITSELKDFAVTSFQECTATISTQVFTNPGDALVANDAVPPFTSSVPVGTVVDDTATVTGIPGIVPTGNVNFALYNNAECVGTALADPFDIKALPGLDTPESVTSDTLTLTTPGSYGFKAYYLGDSNYTEPVYSGCETWTVSRVDTTVNTKVVTGNPPTDDVTNTALDLGTIVQDKATVMGSATLGDPTGTVTFRRFANANCTGNFVDEDQDLSSMGGGMSTALSNPYLLDTEQFACWQVFYNGEDPFYNPSESTIGEPICAFDFDPELP